MLATLKGARVHEVENCGSGVCKISLRRVLLLRADVDAELDTELDILVEEPTSTNNNTDLSAMITVFLGSLPKSGSGVATHQSDMFLTSQIDCMCCASFASPPEQLQHRNNSNT